MKLNKSDRIKYEGSIYVVAAVIWSTVYLQKTDDGCNDYDYSMEDVYRCYKDIEFVEGRIGDKLGKHLYAWALPTMRRNDIIGVRNEGR